MPKVPRGEWEGMTNPESPEYLPTKEELQKDQEIIERLKTDIHYIESKIGTTEEDTFTCEKSKYSATSPDELWDILGYLRIDYLDELKDIKAKAEYEKQISELEREIYKQYIPFIETQINNFGRLNSPLHESYGRKAHPENIENQFDAAGWSVKNLKLSEEEQLEFSGEIDRLREKLERYKREPTLFTFEYLEGKLYEELFSWSVYGRGYGEGTIKMHDEKAYAKELKYYDELIEQAKKLQEIAKGMKDEKIKDESEKKAESIRFWTEREKATVEFPKEYAKMEGTLKDLLQRAKNKETITDEELKNAEAKLDKFEKESSYKFPRGKYSLRGLFEGVKRILAGQDFDEEINFNIPDGGFLWAWNILGVKGSDPLPKIRTAYRKLALKYHPDRNKGDKNAEEKMKKIAEAYSIVKKVHQIREANEKQV